MIFHIITNNEDIFYNYLLDFLFCQNMRTCVNNTLSNNWQEFSNPGIFYEEDTIEMGSESEKLLKSNSSYFLIRFDS